MAENSKKLLWLAAAVSLFVLVVVGAAFLLFSPGKSTEEVPFDLTGKAEPRQDSPQDFLADAPADPSTTKTTSSGDIIIVYGNDPSGQSSAPVEQAKPATTTIYVTPTSTPSPTPSATPTATPAAKPAAPVETAKTVQPKPVQKAPSTPVVKPTTTTVAKAPAKVAPAAQPSTGEYWIQAGSFSVKTNADSLKSAFTEKSLPAVITVKDIDGKSRYNVRVGPYPTRAEASKWLSAAKSVKGAEQAWITQ